MRRVRTGRQPPSGQHSISARPAALRRNADVYFPSRIQAPCFCSCTFFFFFSSSIFAHASPFLRALVYHVRRDDTCLGDDTWGRGWDTEWQASDAAPKTGARAFNEARSTSARSGQVYSHPCSGLVRRRASTRTQRRKEVARHARTGHSAGGGGSGDGVVLVLAQSTVKKGRAESKAKRPACKGTGAQRTATMLVALSIIHDFSSSHLVSSLPRLAVAVACWPVCVCVCGPLATSKCNAMY
jgi:hypothetical protein